MEHQTSDAYQKSLQRTERTTTDPVTFQIQYGF
jgi:hypothetical protein